MKKSILILFFVSFNFYAQDIQNRILLIKEMYKETNKLMIKENTICKLSVHNTLHVDIDEIIEDRERKIEYCNLDNGYSKITITINEPDSYIHEEHYFRYNNLYFSYINYAHYEGEVTYRHYFNSRGDIIRNLIDDGSGNKNFSEGPYLAELHSAIDALLKS